MPFPSSFVFSLLLATYPIKFDWRVGARAEPVTERAPTSPKCISANRHQRTVTDGSVYILQ